MALTPEMNAWLASSRRYYEFYLLHAIANDPVRRRSLAAAIEPTDFSTESNELLMTALKSLMAITDRVSIPLPFPPSLESLQSHIETAAIQMTSDRETVAEALASAARLSDQTYREQWYCIDPYLEAWIGDRTGKALARRVQMAPVADMAELLGAVESNMRRARLAVTSSQEDDMEAMMNDDSIDIPGRIRTGITGLDTCLNGGWGESECYLLFGGTGAGKSVVAAQCAWSLADTGHYPLVITTEMKACEYMVRMVSNACTIPIGLVQDCENYKQIRKVVAESPQRHKLELVERVLAKIHASIRVFRVDADAAISGRALLDRQVDRFAQAIGRRPSWVCLDWLGTVADVNASGKDRERIAMWEFAANDCVRFALASKLPTLVLAQATNDAQTKSILTIQDIGISKGIGKNMVGVIGVTNTMDRAGIAAATRGTAQMPQFMHLQDQFLCMAKARKGEGHNIPVRRDFGYQRFVARN